MEIIVIDADNTIVAGEHRWRALIEKRFCQFTVFKAAPVLIFFYRPLYSFGGNFLGYGILHFDHNELPITTILIIQIKNRMAGCTGPRKRVENY